MWNPLLIPIVEISYFKIKCASLGSGTRQLLKNRY